MLVIFFVFLLFFITLSHFCDKNKRCVSFYLTLFCTERTNRGIEYIFFAKVFVRMAHPAGLYMALLCFCFMHHIIYILYFLKAWYIMFPAILWKCTPRDHLINKLPHVSLLHIADYEGSQTSGDSRLFWKSKKTGFTIYVLNSFIKFSL